MLTDLDNELSKAVSMRFEGAQGGTGVQNVDFQFPPRIISDGKGGSWEERETRGDEPMAYFKTSKSRNIRLEWTYIVGETGGSGESMYWDADRVRNQISGLRGYFHRMTQNGKGDGLVVYFKMWNHGGPEEMTCRILQFDIGHGKSIIIPADERGGADMDKAYPLRTNVSCDLRLWTRAGTAGESGSEESKMFIEALETSVPIEWV